MGPISTNREAIVSQMPSTRRKPPLSERNLALLTQYELRLVANRLSAEWSEKSYPDESSMGEAWRRDVALVRDELRRRGHQLKLFD